MLVTFAMATYILQRRDQREAIIRRENSLSDYETCDKYPSKEERTDADLKLEDGKNVQVSAVISDS